MSKLVKEEKSKSITGKKDRQMLKQKHRRELQEEKLKQQRQEAKAQIEKLKGTGLVSAYEQFLRSICKNGLPEPANVYELAAQYVLKFEKKHRMKIQKKQQLARHNKQLLQGSVHYENISQTIQKSSMSATEHVKK